MDSIETVVCDDVVSLNYHFLDSQKFRAERLDFDYAFEVNVFLFLKGRYDRDTFESVVNEQLKVAEHYLEVGELSVNAYNNYFKIRDKVLDGGNN